MGIVRKLAIGAGGLLGVLVLAGGGGYVWASGAASSKFDTPYDVHRVDFPIPFPLSDDELSALRAERIAIGTNGGTATSADPLDGVDLNAIATERAIARGEHLVKTFYVCAECHGTDFGGGVMVDDPAIGKLLGPNITMGTGSRTLTYTAADWDRTVRHGIKPTGRATPMPSMDFFSMSDRELADIVSYIRSLPPVNKEVPPVSLGPLGKVLVATGKLPLSADIHPTKHQIDHAPRPPEAGANATFGKHLAQTCSGCHGQSFGGGPIVGGPPDWPPAANLTPTGLVDWTYADFVRAMKEGISKNGVALREPMASIPKFGRNMTDIELQALWAYLKDLPPQPTGK